MLYRPKQNYLREQVVAAARAQHTSAGNTSTESNFRSAQAALTTALSYGIVYLSIAIGCLSLGTIVMLTLILLQRRATMTHISTSLAQISAQLKQLRPPA